DSVVASGKDDFDGDVHSDPGDQDVAPEDMPDIEWQFRWQKAGDSKWTTHTAFTDGVKGQSVSFAPVDFGGSGTYNIEATARNAEQPEKDHMSDVDTVNVVTVDEIHYHMESMTFWEIMPDPLYVIKNEVVDFRAVPEPKDVNFPAGAPVWSGTSGVKGTGPESTVLFDTLSRHSEDYKTVSATCGYTIIANVIVNEWNVLEVANTLDFGSFVYAISDRTGGLAWTGAVNTLIEKLARFPVNGSDGSSAADLVGDLAGVVGALAGATYERTPAQAEPPGGEMEYETKIPATIPSVEGTLSKETHYESTESFPGKPDRKIGCLDHREGDLTYEDKMVFVWTADGEYGTEAITFDGKEHGTIVRTVDLSLESAYAIPGNLPAVEEPVIASYAETMDLNEAMYDDDIKTLKEIKAYALVTKAWLKSVGLEALGATFEALVNQYVDWIKEEMTKELNEFDWQAHSNLATAELLPQETPKGGADPKANTVAVIRQWEKVVSKVQKKIDDI
ncbi:MAG: hypothetical protein R6V03_00755, partial [Kiritimatiellia bacterium]